MTLNGGCGGWGDTEMTRVGLLGLLDRAKREPSIEIDQLRLLSQLHHIDVYCTNQGTNLSTNSEYQVPGACSRKGKRRKNFHFTTGLRYNGEPHDLPPAGRV